MTEYMPWVLSAFTCANIWLVGSKRREGFVVGMAAQPLWLAFDWHVGAYGLMPLALVLGWLYVRGWLKWGADSNRIGSYVVVRDEGNTLTVDRDFESRP